jgi:hypothetical protein
MRAGAAEAACAAVSLPVALLSEQAASSTDDATNRTAVTGLRSDDMMISPNANTVRALPTTGVAAPSGGRNQSMMGG